MKMLPLFATVGGLALLGLGSWFYTPDKSREQLEARYLRSRADLIDVAGVRLHVRDDGPRQAPVLLLLHGFGASLHTWEPLAAALQDRFRVIRFDLPGFGLTGPDPTGDYSDERGIAIVAALLDRLQIARSTPIGNSLGGRLAWRFAAVHPGRVVRLVLISPDGFATAGFEYGKAPNVPLAMQLMRYSLPTPLVKMSLAPAYADPAFLTDALVTRYRDLMLVPGVRAAILARMEQVMLVPPEPLLRTIRAPTLLLWGEKDALIPYANAQDYLAALPNAKLVAFPHLGHLPHEESPAETAAALRSFLE
jgi:pimeloyl-ACP methyl ester carboxylesterase